MFVVCLLCVCCVFVVCLLCVCCVFVRFKGINRDLLISNAIPSVIFDLILQ